MRTVFSDNATDFVGADAELKRSVQELSEKDMQSYMLPVLNGILIPRLLPTGRCVGAFDTQGGSECVSDRVFIMHPE